MIKNIFDILAKYPEVVSEAVILRDHLDSVGYLNSEHEALSDIADTLYHANIEPERLKSEYKSLYDKMDKKYWTRILDDIFAIKEQAGDDNRNFLRLQADYYNRKASIIDEVLSCIEE